ncbi:MAG: hypothetical protein HYR91_13105 [Flavobacteriia bacterium]|nr:hypothetical protein [Flavobacteriia bacterium]
MQVVSNPYRNSTFSGCLTFEKSVKNACNYEVFGMEMPGRVYNAGDYRFGYNGMEKDPEIKGDGNSYTTEFRQYDPRLGRWKSLDPLMSQFPWMSPFVAFDNNPVYYTDLLGLAATGGDKDKKYRDAEKSANRWIRKNTRKGNIEKGATFEIDPLTGDIAVFYKKAQKTEAVTTDKKENGVTEISEVNVVKFSKVFKQSQNIPDKAFTPDLEMRVQCASSGVSFDVAGASLGIDWSYLLISAGKGWWERGYSVISHAFGLPSLGTSLGKDMIPDAKSMKEFIKNGYSIELLTIGGGTIKINKAYWKKHHTRSLTQFLNNKTFTVTSGGAGYQFTYISVTDCDGVVAAVITLHAFSLSCENFSIGDDDHEFICPLAHEDSVKSAIANNTPRFRKWLKKRK